MRPMLRAAARAARRRETQRSVSTLILLRHGQSKWNGADAIFSGWVDVPLTVKGRVEAVGAGQLLRERGFPAKRVDVAFTSNLQRAHETCELALASMAGAQQDTWHSDRIRRDARLNERHYGSLQGWRKADPELVQGFGSDMLLSWRRTMDAKPPPMTKEHHHYDPDAPRTETLRDCQKRVVACWETTIAPALFEEENLPTEIENRTILVAAHSNTLRMLMAYFDEVAASSAFVLTGQLCCRIGAKNTSDNALAARSAISVDQHRIALSRRTRRQPTRASIKRTMRVAWTGFGQFQGVEANPSAVLAQRLAAQHSTEGDSVEILEVSAAAAKAWRCPDAELVVHLGVAITYDAITLERCAYNDASFRVPDERAFQPSKAPIDESELFGAARTSSIDLAAVARKAGVNVSDDAGRFVCNYLYFCSLAHGVPCVFVHVPPVERVPLEAQVETLARLRGYLVEAVGSNAVDVLADVAAAANGAGVLDQLVSLGIDPERAAFAVAAGATSVEAAMELLFAEEPPAPPPSHAMKMVLVVREDLGMSRGKVAAQCAHAALGGARRADASVIERWAGAGETVVVVAAPHEGLSALRDAASNAGLPHCLVADAGRTEVEPGTETVLAVGPAEVSRVDAITGRLRLLR